MTNQQALALTEVGKPLSLITRPIPKPTETQILVKVLVAGGMLA
jgi:D-arabinose 1-dehydrogenase-like Zn-dependent alcohol dehydrogenase